MDDSFAEIVVEAIGGPSAGVAVSDALRAMAADLGLEALELSDGESQAAGRLLVCQSAVEGGLNGSQSSVIGHGQSHLLLVHC